MKHLMQFTLGFIVAFGIVYLCSSTIEGDFNCSVWSEHARVVCVIAGTLCGLFLGFVAEDRK